MCLAKFNTFYFSLSILLKEHKQLEYIVKVMMFFSRGLDIIVSLNPEY